MKPQTSVLLTLLASSATASFLTQGNGRLPACASQCAVLVAAEQACRSSWSCFCSTAYTKSGESPTTMCESSCTNPTDNTAVSTWFTANCGSDNGASEHGRTGGGGGSGGSPAQSSSAPSSSVTSTGVDSSSSSSGSDCSGSWWSCHYKWVIAIIVIAVGLIALGVGGRLLKNRYDRKQDQIREGFNSGITSRNAHITDDKAAGAAGARGNEAGHGRDAPARDRDAFMPYGYGYSRSESRMRDGRSSPVPRGSSPVNEMEKGGNNDSPGAREKLRRVLVRERSARS